MSRTIAKLERISNECKQINDKIQTRIVEADFSSKEAANLDFYEAIFKELEDLEISIVINCAGVMHVGEFSKPDKPHNWKEIIDVNVLHIAMMTSYFLPNLIKRKHSALINVSSMVAFFNGCASGILYNSSKAYVSHFTQAIAMELENSHIDV